MRRGKETRRFLMAVSVAADYNRAFQQTQFRSV